MNLSYYFYYKALKFLKCGLASRGGRNFLGRICVHHQGGGLKKNYRLIDFFRRVNSLGFVVKLSFDCNRSSLLALVLYNNGLSSFIIATDGLRKGSLIYSGLPDMLLESLNDYEDILGWALPLHAVKLFSVVNMIESSPKKGSSLVRSAGSSGLLVGYLAGKAVLKLNSCWQVFVDKHCMASVGTVSNVNFKYFRIDSAGKARGLGIRPRVRGVAKNPCDHPHGGGNGKKSKKPCPVNRYGVPSVGHSTKNRKIDRQKRRLFKKIL